MSESFATPHPGEQQAPHPSRGIIFCPRCGSPQTQAKNRAKKLGGASGTCFGIANSFSGAAKGAAACAAIGLRATAQPSSLSRLPAGVLRALAGGAIGGAAGATLGQVIDDTVLNHSRCFHCGHPFPAPQPFLRRTLMARLVEQMAYVGQT